MARKAAAPPDPDQLVRQRAGRYRTTDERFEVREADTGWFLVDTAQANEFGQELMLGPFPTLKAVREEIPDARSARAASAKPRGSGRATKPAQAPKRARVEPSPPPPPTWIEGLPRTEATEVRRVIAALEAQGIPHPEALVRRDREGLFPAIATRLIEARLDELVAEAPADERDRARRLVRRAATILSADQTARSGVLPGWALVEIGPGPEPRNRRIAFEDDGSA